jgi:hypothetical protein
VVYTGECKIDCVNGVPPNRWFAVYYRAGRIEKE